MANTAAIAKKANTALVINAIRQAGSITVDEIASVARMSRPTVVAILKDLEKRHILKRAGHAKSEVGRQPTLYSINDNSHFAIGIDIDGPPARLALMDLAGNLRHTVEWLFSDIASAEDILANLVDAVDTAISAAGVKPQDVLGIGLGLPASVDIDLSRAVNLSRLTALRDLPIAEQLNEATGIPVFVRNDAHLIALAEVVEDSRDYLYVIFRTGVGMALVIDAEVFEGESGNAGFIGHATLDPNGPVCECGARGCLEAIVSKRTIVRDYQRATGKILDYDSVMAAAARQEAPAVTVVQEAGRWLGLAIANLIKTLDIYDVVLGDLGCDAGHPFFVTIQETVLQNTRIFLQRTPVLRAGRLVGAGFARGGAQSVIDQFFATPRLRLRAGVHVDD